MTAGHHLVSLSPQERRHEHRMMEAVQQAATEIAHEYLAEIAPYIGALDLDALFRCLPGPVLTRHELQGLCTDPACGTNREHALQALYRVGLLGYVQHDIVRGEWRQRFLRPGDATLEPNGVLPGATHHLLHPVLWGVVGRLNPDFLQRIDRLNIVGHDRPWKVPGGTERTASTALLCVLKADVHGFGKLMAQGADGPVRSALAAAVQRWAPPGAISEATAGDSVLVVCDDPVALAQTARHLMDEVYAATGQPRLRIALHHGEVRTRERDSDLQQAVVGGSAILCAARVEPVVEPGQIWATEAFREQFVQRPSLWRTVPLAPPTGEEQFNVAKISGGEPPLWVRLHRLES